MVDQKVPEKVFSCLLQVSEGAVEDLEMVLVILEEDEEVFNDNSEVLEKVSPLKRFKKVSWWI